jgi:hypothetical protein
VAEEEEEEVMGSNGFGEEWMDDDGFGDEQEEDQEEDQEEQVLQEIDPLFAKLGVGERENGALRKGQRLADKDVHAEVTIGLATRAAAVLQMAKQAKERERVGQKSSNNKVTLPATQIKETGRKRKAGQQSKLLQKLAEKKKRKKLQQTKL